MIDADYADVLVLFANTPAQAQFLLYSLKQAGRDMVSTWKQMKQFMCFKENIITLQGKPLKLENFPYLSSNIFSTESDVNIGLAKAWTTTRIFTSKL